eukprot:8051756-Pyramimonas_sp.AAC.1
MLCKAKPPGPGVRHHSRREPRRRASEASPSTWRDAYVTLRPLRAQAARRLRDARVQRCDRFVPPQSVYGGAACGGARAQPLRSRSAKNPA